MGQAQRKNTMDLPVYMHYQILRGYLLKQTRYVTQRDITKDVGLSGTETRAVCNAYPCLAIGTTEGYRLAKYASKGEVQHAVSTLMNRSIKMLNRAQALSGLLSR